MTVQQWLVVAAAGMLVVLAVTRLVRVHLGRTAHPAGKARLPFVLAFLFAPPIVVDVAYLQPASSAQWLHLFESVLLYLGALALFSVVMGIAALIARLIAPGRSRRYLLLALVGTEPDPGDVAFAAALTPDLSESVARVDSANAAFPRGPDFESQVDRPGFRAAWDALDGATVTLEGQIADDRRLGVAVSYTAVATAQDARTRLESLRRIATDHGQVWAT
jgi:hypothetical protein